MLSAECSPPSSDFGAARVQNADQRVGFRPNRGLAFALVVGAVVPAGVLQKEHPEVEGFQPLTSGGGVRGHGGDLTEGNEGNREKRETSYSLPGSPPDAVWDGVLLDVEANFWLGRGRRRGHELADGVENGLELGIVFSLEAGQFAGKVGVSEEHFTKADKGAHDGDIHLGGAGAAKDAGQHGHALFGEGVGKIGSASVFSGTHHRL